MTDRVDWIIHAVIGEGNTVYHTHGLKEHGLLELELNLPLKNQDAQIIINTIALHLVNENKIVKDKERISDVLSVDVEFMLTKQIFPTDGEEDEISVRIILPDTNMTFPNEEGCQEIYQQQVI